MANASQPDQVDPGASADPAADIPPGRSQVGQQARHCGPGPPAKDDRSQLANYKGGCS